MTSATLASNSLFRLAFTTAVAVVISGCIVVPERNAVPESLVDEAAVTGFEKEVRYWGDEAPPYSTAWTTLSDEEIERRFSGIIGREHNYLALSGGGSNGAFGAGLLVGWTAHGDRPEFTIVTGISTGALIAPFAFLGSKYDDELKKAYTETTTADIVEKRGILAMFRKDAAADTTPFRETLAEFYDQDVIDELGAEYRKGRQLLIGTTNIDTLRSVLWNVTRIAASGSPDALALIHEIIVASASIPVFMPPVVFEVEANGQTYDELHVDGGVTAQITFVPLEADFEFIMERLDVKGRPDLYLIRNSHANPEWQAVDQQTLELLTRSFESLIRTQGIGDMYRLYLAAVRDGMNYYLAQMPADFEGESNEVFDPVYMRKLFDTGYELGRNGYPWKSAPPGVIVEDLDPEP